MPEFVITLDKDDLDLLGTDNQRQIEERLSMLAEVALSEIPAQILMPAQTESNPKGPPSS